MQVNVNADAAVEGREASVVQSAAAVTAALSQLGGMMVSEDGCGRDQKTFAVARHGCRITRQT